MSSRSLVVLTPKHQAYPPVSIERNSWLRVLQSRLADLSTEMRMKIFQQTSVGAQGYECLVCQKFEQALQQKLVQDYDLLFLDPREVKRLGLDQASISAEERWIDYAIKQIRYGGPQASKLYYRLADAAGLRHRLEKELEDECDAYDRDDYLEIKYK